MNKYTIIKMLEYSGLAYNDDEFAKNKKNFFAINDLKTDVFYSIRIKNDSIIIVFRGSDSKKDWSFNLNFFKKVIPYGNKNSKIKIHAGFLNAYKNVRSKIKEFITQNIKKIYLTGHSYGAALALICAVDLQYNFPDKDYEVVVFGCPRVGNVHFQKSYNKRIFKTLRVEVKEDIITKLPFSIMGYRHVGGRLILNKNFKFKIPNIKSHCLQEYYSRIWDV